MKHPETGIDKHSEVVDLDTGQRSLVSGEAACDVVRIGRWGEDHYLEEGLEGEEHTRKVFHGW